MANGVSRLLLADTSGWAHAHHPKVVGSWEDALSADRLATTPPVQLEVLYTARSADEYELIASELDALAQVPCGTETFERALEVQRLLAHRGGLHHRSVKLPDLVIAAAAELAGAIMWHYDKDYERISEVTGQPNQWIARRGSL